MSKSSNHIPGIRASQRAYLHNITSLTNVFQAIYDKQNLQNTTGNVTFIKLVTFGFYSLLTNLNVGALYTVLLFVRNVAFK